MRLRNLLGEIGATYDRQLPTSSEAQLLLRRAPVEFEQWIPAGYLVEGGKGKPTVTPRIAVFAADETTGSGIYVAYLFAADMSTVTLSLNQGVTEIAKDLGRAGARQTLAWEAARIRATLSRHDVADLDTTMDLRTTAGLAVDYQRANILARTYRLDALPSERRMVADLRRFIGLYALVLRALGRGVEVDYGSCAAPARRPPARRPTEPTKPAEAGKPTDTKKPAEVGKPTDAKKSAEVGKPTDTRKSAEATKKSAEVGKPTDTKKPAEVGKPTDTRKPAEAGKPTDTKKPVEAGKPTDTKKPVEAEKPGDTKKPAEATNPADTTRSAKTKKATKRPKVRGDARRGPVGRAVGQTKKITRRGLLVGLAAVPVVAVLAPATLGQEHAPEPDEPHSSHAPTSRFTIDVSQHDWNRRGGNLDWEAVREAGIAGMVARATYGDPAGFTYPTSHFADFTRGARAAGMPLRGGYHNLIRGDQASINRQVDWLRRELDANHANWALLDIERYGELVAANLWPRWDDVRRFDDRWAALEDRVLVGYLPPWNWRNHLGRPDLRAFRGPLVSSDYPLDKTADEFKRLYSRCGGDKGRGWTTYGNRVSEGWQFSSRAKVPGASTYCDISAWRMTFDELHALLVEKPARAIPRGGAGSA